MNSSRITVEGPISPSTLSALDENTITSMLQRARRAGQDARVTQLRTYLSVNFGVQA